MGKRTVPHPRGFVGKGGPGKDTSTITVTPKSRMAATTEEWLKGNTAYLSALTKPAGEA